jgi:hypothetical protein
MRLAKLLRRFCCARRMLAVWFALGLLAGASVAQVAPVAWSAPARVAAPHQQPLGLAPARFARIRQLIADPEAACLPARAAGTGVIAEAAAALRQSPVGAWLLDQAAAHDVVICLDPDTALAAYYRAQLSLIGVQATLSPPAKALFLAHELAHVLQHPDYSNDRSWPVADLILMHRIREATAEAVATRVLWQLRRRGHPEPWQAKLATGYGDIARAFAATMAGGDEDDGARELAATRAAFDQWFAWPLRLEQYDSHMLDHVARIARDQPVLDAPRRRLTDDFLRGIARHAGESFLTADAHPPLTAAAYRAGLSPGNAARLAAITAAGTALVPAATAALPAPGPPDASR